jgi:hypothetical protein
LFALADKFEPAQFIVTNTRYNEAYMKTFLGSAHWPKLFVIHNGVDLHRFVPPIKPPGRDSSLKLLCVARLIEQKGPSICFRPVPICVTRGTISIVRSSAAPKTFMNYYLALNGCIATRT